MRCPECEADLEDSMEGYELDIGENVNCPECSVELKVVTVEPLTVTLVDTDAE